MQNQLHNPTEGVRLEARCLGKRARSPHSHNPTAIIYAHLLIAGDFPEEPVRARAEPDLLRQAVANLITKALLTLWWKTGLFRAWGMGHGAWKMLFLQGFHQKY